MNREEVKRLDRVEMAVKDNTKQLEKITTNDLPHLIREVSQNTGKLKVIIPLVIFCLAGIGGLYLLIVSLLGG